MNIPPEALPWIGVHRTHIDSKNLQEAYAKSLREDYQMIRSFLPEHCESILDIGCGMAGIDTFFYTHYQKQIHLHLMDGTGDTDEKIGFHDEMEPYNNLAITKKLLMMNGVIPEHIHFHPINAELTIPCDVIISLLSWGFHYPANTYCELAKRSLRSGGIIILDVRKGTDYRCLKRNFKKMKTIYKRERKVLRMVFRAK